MSKNHMAEVAKMLGVEVGEAFKIIDDTHSNYRRYYRFTKNVGVETSDDDVHWKKAIAEALECLLMGDVKVVKLPWKPQKGEKYYIPRISIRLEDRYYWYHWQNSDADIKRYTMGLVCKTREEAIEMTKKMLAVVENER